MRLLLPVLLSAALVSAQGYGYGGGYGGGDDNGGGDSSNSGGDSGGGDDSASGNSGSDDTASSPIVPTSSSSSAAASATGNPTSLGVTGGKTCPNNIMCITATVNASTTLYELSAVSSKPGWMAIGFGQTMANSPMVIMWANADGTVTLSQRQADNEIMPTVVPSPPRVATLDDSASEALAALPTFAFTIPTQSGTKQNLIWAFGSTNPGSKDASATLVQHDIGSSGPIILDVSQPVGVSGTPTASGSELPPLSSSQKLIVAHAVVFAIAFMLLLPVGALFARLLRTSTTFWFKAHWIVQFYITAPAIILGFAFSVAGVQQHGSGHFNDDHKRLGLVICILYVVQCSLGAIIHFIKSATRLRRPPQNYLHAVLGLVIIGLALAQVHSGYDKEWNAATGRGEVSNGVKIVWIIWVVLLPVLYFGGLAFLPRQLRMEREERQEREASGFADKRQMQRSQDA
ncbi:hypothetical protein EXIGLDRAFT_716508 [Exidia glandulosa HHB12029]|uniref:CBD9-like protein n=1 Tax=Exidia glandulosa HHB12029 TaxID=1314781 RepID=A0A165P9Y9_EXIGL|nr:hypothetical protein EXIGLDRAFT_716508 [Exidia glandulosa HHB12029]